ncbi:MAG: amidase [Rhodospirillaceae bacterium]|nr:amidase [Rhodospirillaceae bacterium]
MPKVHHVGASPSTVHWGYFDAALPPVLEVDSGDTVILQSVSGGPDNLPSDDYYVPPELYEIHDKVPRKMLGHILTGPIKIKGARPGHVLQVDILRIKLRQDWGYNFVKPLSGALPGEFDETSQIIVRLHEEKNEGELPWGTHLPLKPFFGVMGCAPPAKWGMISSIAPRAHGGNMDNKELVAGTTLFLPIFIEGAHFSVGDGHGCQGDGEVCVTAIETALEGEFCLTLRNDLSIDLPQAESPSHYISMAFDEDLDDAAKEALRQMIRLITQKTNLSKTQAYSLCSLAADLRVTQMVNGNKGVHVMLPKTAL